MVMVIWLSGDVWMFDIRKVWSVAVIDDMKERRRGLDLPRTSRPCLSCLAAGDALRPRQRLAPPPVTTTTTNRPTKFSFMFSKRKLEMQGWMPLLLLGPIIVVTLNLSLPADRSQRQPCQFIMSFDKLKLIRKCGSLLFHCLTMGQHYKALIKQSFRIEESSP